MSNKTESKRQAVITTEVHKNPDGTPHAVTFACPILGKSLTVRSMDLPTAMVAYAAMHGIKQKGVDAAAMSRDEKTGRSATPAEKWAAVTETMERVLSGQWNANREGGGTSEDKVLFMAVCRVFSDKKPETLKGWLDAKSAAEKKAIAGNTKIAAAIQAIREEQASAAGIDSDEQLAELDDLE